MKTERDEEQCLDVNFELSIGLVEWYIYLTSEERYFILDTLWHSSQSSPSSLSGSWVEKSGSEDSTVEQQFGLIKNKLDHCNRRRNCLPTSLWINREQEMYGSTISCSFFASQGSPLPSTLINIKRSQQQQNSLGGIEFLRLSRKSSYRNLFQL